MNVLSPSMPLYGTLSLFRTSFPGCYAFPCVLLGCDVSTCKPYVDTKALLRSFYEESGLKNRQNFSSGLGKLACWSQIIDRGTGHHSFVRVLWTPWTFCCFVSRSTFHDFAFLFLVFLYFSPLQSRCTKTEDCWTTWLQAPLASAMVDLPWWQDFGHGIHALDVFPTSFRVVFVVVSFFFSFFFHWFSLSFSFSLWWLRRILLWVEIVCIGWDVIPWTTTQCIDICLPFKASGPFAIGKRAGYFGAHSVQAQQRWGWQRQGLPGALGKKPELEGCLPNLKFHTPANPQTHTEQTHESIRAEGFLLSLGGSRPATAFKAPTFCHCPS